jgi:hypothetical protein
LDATEDGIGKIECFERHSQGRAMRGERRKGSREMEKGE